MTIKLEGRGGKALVARPLVDELFFFAASLTSNAGMLGIHYIFEVNTICPIKPFYQFIHVFDELNKSFTILR